MGGFVAGGLKVVENGDGGFSLTELWAAESSSAKGLT